jgi:hypothetical protein
MSVSTASDDGSEWEDDVLAAELDEDDSSTDPATCLFCPETTTPVATLLAHMLEAHGFDFVQTAVRLGTN